MPRKRPRSCCTCITTASASAASSHTKSPRPRSRRSWITRARINIRCNVSWKKSERFEMPVFSRALEKTLRKALAIANERRHEYATLEHLLLALIDDPDGAAVLKACNVEIDVLRKNVSRYIDTELENLVVEAGEEAKATAGFQRVVQRAAIHVQSSGREEVTGANVLVAIFAERESHAVYFLQTQDMTRLDAVNFISHGIAKAPGRSEARRVQGADEEERAEKPAQQQQKRGHDALDAYCVNLNKKARNGKIDPLI